VFSKLNLTLYIFVIILLTSCTAGVRENNLYDTYHTYSSKLKANGNYSDQELDHLFQHFSPRYQTEVLNGRDRSTDVIRHLITKYFSTLLELKNTLSHYEIHSDKNSCLLINTMNQQNERISLYIRYINKQRWLIDNVNIEYLGEQEQYLKTPICDSEMLMKKRMEAWN